MVSEYKPVTGKGEVKAKIDAETKRTFLVVDRESEPNRKIVILLEGIYARLGEVIKGLP